MEIYSTDPLATDPALATIIDAWPKLPEALQDGILAMIRAGNPHADMAALVAALEPFKGLSLAAFIAKLQLAKEYEVTGKITAPTGGKRTISGTGSPKNQGVSQPPRRPTVLLRTKADVAAVQEAVRELESLYSHAADVELAYTTIEATIKRIHDAFDRDGLREVAKGFKITSGISTKKGCREKIEQKIKERKARNEKGGVIAAAANAASSAEPDLPTVLDDDILEATLLENP